MVSNRNYLNLIEARKKAVLWHRAQKEKRINVAELESNNILSALNKTDQNIVILALSLLYLGEGLKKDDTSLANTDPLILNFFVHCLLNIFNVNISKIACELHLRADQNEQEIKIYWSNTLNIPLNQFKKTSFDKRTIGRPTYENYKGVCLVRCGNVAIRRKLVYLGRKFCEDFINRTLNPRV
jgi:hypothetical protein